MIEEQLQRLLLEALDAAEASGALEVGERPTVELTQPPRREHGDWATNLALVLQKQVGKPPREVAGTIVDHLPARDWVEDVQIAGPGFINLFLSNRWLYDACQRTLDDADRYGSSTVGAGTSVNVEFVSANPTGPLHIGTARNAALGDAVARLLAYTGYDVTREYYYNDAGRQMALFGASVATRYLQRCGRDAPFPEDGYQGEYIDDLAARIHAEDGDRYAPLDGDALTDAIRDRAYPMMLAWIEETLDRFGVRFDVWFKERDLYRSGAVEETLARLRDAGHIAEDEGATWLESGPLGDDRDRRVLVKSDGSFTYLAGDLAYHADKAARGFGRMILVLGADHHGQVPSLKAGMKALSVEPERIEVILYQLVHLERGGEPVSMGKRAGSFVTLDELCDEVGVDAARYTLLQTAAEHDIRFDIEEVAKQTLENPVYYVQYAHARIASILRKAPGGGGEVPWHRLTEEAELDVMRAVADFPETVSGAAAGRAPSRVARYAEDLARRYHRFYTDHRVISEDLELTQARLALSRATKQVIANALGLLGVSAPERMERQEDEA